MFVDAPLDLDPRAKRLPRTLSGLLITTAEIGADGFLPVTRIRGPLEEVEEEEAVAASLEARPPKVIGGVAD